MGDCKKKETTHEVLNKIAIEDKGSDYIFCILFFSCYHVIGL